MNLLAATTLSTQRKAYRQHKINLAPYQWRMQYIYIAEGLDNDKFNLMIFHVTYPEENDNHLGKPCIAEKHHFEKQCSFGDMRQFMEEREWNIDNGWMPLEDDTDVTA
jgi:hypothetical protein